MKSLSEFDTLEKAKEYPHTDTRMMSADMLCAMLAQYKVANFLCSLTDDSATILKMRLSTNGEFNFSPTHPLGAGNLAYIDWLIETYPEMDPPLGMMKQALVDYCNYTTNPYADATLLQFSQAKGYKSDSTPISWPTDGIVTVSANLPERAPISLWAVRDGREPKNIGRTEYLSSGSVDIYVGDIRSKYPQTQIIARVPFADVIVSIA